jgi:hypothetical protein
MVSAIERTIDQSRQPGRNRTRVRSPDRFQITNIVYPPGLGKEMTRPRPPQGPGREPLLVQSGYSESPGTPNE